MKAEEKNLENGLFSAFSKTRNINLIRSTVKNARNILSNEKFVLFQQPRGLLSTVSTICPVTLIVIAPHYSTQWLSAKCQEELASIFHFCKYLAVCRNLEKLNNIRAGSDECSLGARHGALQTQQHSN